MRRIYLIILTIIILTVPILQVSAVPTDVNSVRRMLTAFDNQDFTIFDEEQLVESLIEIIENDPADAPFHDRVVGGALVVLAELRAEGAVDLLIEHLDSYTTTCLYWLGTYATPESINAIVEYLGSDDPSVRYEAATALGTISLDGLTPVDGLTPEIMEIEEDLLDALNEAVGAINSRLEIEDDEAVLTALTLALEHISILD